MNHQHLCTFFSTVVCAACTLSEQAIAAEWRGNVSVEASYFFDSSGNTDNWQAGSAFAADIEFYHDLTDNVSLTINPFIRVDQHDEQRTHANLREFVISTSGDTWEFNGGLNQVFWGVTESRNVVDIINQTDNVEGSDDEDKLGQLMLNLNWFNDLGDFELYLLPQFSERTFAGIDGRPYSGFIVDTDAAQYESSRGSRNMDVALRWTRSFDYWETGLHYFSGTARAPTLIPKEAGVLLPRYQLMQQTGIDAQGLFGDLSVKTEIVYQRGDELENHIEAVNGIEYTLVGAMAPLQEKQRLPGDWCIEETNNFIEKFLCNDRLDIGIVVEHLWDQRGDTTPHPFQNDLLAGARFAFNDEGSSDALIGLIQDLDGGATTFSIDISTRIFDSYRLSMESFTGTNFDNDRILGSIKDESFVRVDLSYFF